MKGCTPARLKEIFTCEDQTKPEHKIRCEFEDEIRTRLQSGLMFCAQNASLYQAVDLAWDSTPVQKETIPLQLFAQGKIKVEHFSEELKRLQISNTDRFCEKGPDGTIKKICVPRLYEVTFSLIRSYTMRRLAAQSARFSNLWPYFKYDPRGTSPVDKLRAEVTSQRMDIMTDQYNYRHLGDQCIRDCFLYSHSVIFPTCAWDRKPNWRLKIDATGVTKEIESFVEREGVEYINPHPTRVFWDRSSPLANINSDTGPDWIGYWDIVKFGNIMKNPAFFNLSHVRGSDSFAALVRMFPAFFRYYFDPTVLQPPDFSFNPSDLNDRTLNAPVFSALQKDKGMVLTNIAMRVNPVARGIGDYPFDTWIRFVVASDDTIVGAEFMPSLPAGYGGINEHDGRVINPSMAHDLMGFQDQCTNILSQLLMNMKASLLQIWMIDQDALDDETKKYIEDTLKAKDYYVNPHMLLYSGAKLKDDTGVDPSKMITVVRAQMEIDVNQSFDALLKLLAIVERLLVMSPNEIGQPNDREVSATETQQIATSVQSIYSFISNGVDELRAAMKKICWESALVCSTQPFRVAATRRYSKKTIEEARFKVEGQAAASDDKNDEPDFHTIIATGDAMGYDHIYTTRDGDERTSDTQSAAQLIQLLQVVLSSPPLAEKVGPDRLMEMLSQTARLLGVYDLNFDLGEGEDKPMGMDPEQLQKILELLNNRLTMLEQQARGGVPAPGGQPAGAPGPTGAPVPVAAVLPAQAAPPPAAAMPAQSAPPPAELAAIPDTSGASVAAA